MTSAGGAGEWWAKHGSIFTITAAGGNTSSGSSGRRWERQRAGKLQCGQPSRPSDITQD